MTLHLRRVRLVNWHNFIDSTIEVRRHLFLVGENGSGKTTVLDAVHWAVSGGVGVELNAAARLAGAREDAGRSLAGVILRHDLARGVRRSGGTLGYALVEVADDGSDEVTTFGIGALATAIDARPDAWGFVVPGPLESVPVVVTDADGRRRPVDKQTLAAAIGEARVRDLGRYRSELGRALFGEREGFERVAELLAAGKAYRALVAKARHFGDLFAELLPPPDARAIEEVRAALRAIRDVEVSLTGLRDELGALARLVAHLARAAEAREAEARYRWLLGRHLAEDCARARASTEQAAAGALVAVREAQAAEAEALAAEAESDAQLSRLRASPGADVVERRARAAADLAIRDQRVARLEVEVARLAERRRAAAERATAIGDELTHALTRADIGAAVVAEQAVLVPALAAPATALLAALAARRVDASFVAAHGRVRSALAAEQPRAAAAQVRAAGEQIEATRALDEARARLAALTGPATLLPAQEGLPEALAQLAAAGITALPLHRLIAIAAGPSEASCAAIEALLGATWLGAIVVAEDDLARARALVEPLAAGVRMLAAASTATAPHEALHDGPRVGTWLRVDDSSGALDAAPWLQSRARDALAALDAHFGSYVLAAAHQADALSRSARPYVGDDGTVFDGRSVRRLPLAPPAWLGEQRYVAAVDAARRARELEVRSAAASASAAAERLARSEAVLAAATRVAEVLAGELDARVLVDLHDRATYARHDASDLEARLAQASADLAEDRRAHADAAAELEALERAVARAGLADFAARVAAAELEARAASERTRLTSKRTGVAVERAEQLGRAAHGAREAAERAEHELAVLTVALRHLLSPETGADLAGYVLGTMRGAQIKPDNLPGHIDRARREGAEAIGQIEGRDGLLDPLLSAKYAFRFEREALAIAAHDARPLGAIHDELAVRVAELERVLDERRRDLLERLVLEDLADTLRKELFGLSDTLRALNRLIRELSFGQERYTFELTVRPEHARVVEILRNLSPLDPGAREDLVAYFDSRIADATEHVDGVPPMLDYRRWHDYRLRRIAADGTGVELDRAAMRVGSGGEQAVPNYLILFALAKLLYDKVGARFRPLVLDEAFYGVDAGRRDQLVRLADTCGLDLVVATPDTDGLCEGMQRSTTLLVERNAEGDVSLSDYHFVRSDAPAQTALFDAAPLASFAETESGIIGGGVRRGEEPSA